MTDLCIECLERPRKKGRRRCERCSYRREKPRDPKKISENKKRRRIARGGLSREEIHLRSLAKKQEKERSKRPINILIQHGLSKEEASKIKHRLAHYLYTKTQKRSAKAEQWRRLADSQSDGTITKTALIALLIAYDSCPDCGTTIPLPQRSLDHVQSLSSGGNHSISNLRVVCVRCNRSKGGREGAQIRNERRAISS